MGVPQAVTIAMLDSTVVSSVIAGTFLLCNTIITVTLTYKFRKGSSWRNGDKRTRRSKSSSAAGSTDEKETDEKDT